MKLLTLLTTLCAASTAFAQADLVVSIDDPGDLAPYAEGRFEVTVSNIGNRHANNSVVDIELPQTATSPNVFVMGILGQMSNNCSLSDQTISCSLGRIRKNKSKTVYFDIAFPVSTAPHLVTATAASNSEGPTNNNSASHVTNLDYVETPFTGPRTIVNRHCTGQGLQGFYECTLFPSSISSHSVVLEANGTITFQQQGFTGTWSRPSPDSLHFEYEANGQTQAVFDGYGIGNDCFEGITTFPPNPPWMAPYKVCLQP